ncbi:membrane protein insertase YidC [Priestia filamentosa]|uniref:Membrane protein insertase YidC n=1 Tax=Priestia filamentosa TaxID=1402861 RepID=A0A1X7F786_9BACI|nr:membrane protein insertase YidC [Priestia filamentosa]AKO91751.1 OxaA precursor [Priestia filamentosa]MDT3761888.1 membrane protein insertase YidC [Priestia filamentosa]OXS67974.1 OxaA precursor [Priestia filamentosa]RJS64825.1 OxaA precursor [Priestia filamentosa]WCM16977.1 membrane protein insertase YidC [Priestia filamentosa]
MKKKLALFIPALFLLAGCSIKEPITADSTGIWNEYFVYPMSQLLTHVAHWLGNEYGLSIILVTILIRLILLPLIIRQQRSTMAMQALRPEMEKLREKYPSKDAQSQQKLQQEMMQLYQKHSINPIGGCLPIFIQMPIIMAFYYAIARTQEIADHSFLWVSLGAPDPYFIFPIVAACTTFLQVKAGMTTDEVLPQMKIMMYIMPVFVLIAGLSLPSALALYWVIGNVFGTFQGLYLKKRMTILKAKDAEKKNNA